MDQLRELEETTKGYSSSWFLQFQLSLVHPDAILASKVNPLRKVNASWTWTNRLLGRSGRFQPPVEPLAKNLPVTFQQVLVLWSRRTLLARVTLQQ